MPTKIGSILIGYAALALGFVLATSALQEDEKLNRAFFVNSSGKI